MSFSNISSYVPPSNAEAYRRMQLRLDMGEEQRARVVAQVSEMVIRDRLVPPNAMTFEVSRTEPIALRYGTEGHTFRIHRHALTQLAQKVSLPVTYVNHLQAQEPWAHELLCHNLNTLYTRTEFHDKSGNPRFLHRIVGDQLRGFLSRRFNRHLASAPLLRAFLMACADATAQPFEAIATDVKIALKMCLPHIFEPVPGEYVCLGVEWSNSDFGAGRMQVALTLWAPKGERFAVLDHSLSRVHIGSVIEESDIELSDATAQKEVDAQSSAIRDAVMAQLSPESVERVLSAIAAAHEDAVPWHRLRGNLAKFINKKEIETLHEALNEGIIDLPPVPRVDGELRPTKWWGCAALGWLARNTMDAERKLDLQHAAGTFLQLKDK